MVNNKLRELRQEKGMSVKQMSECIGVSKSMYEKIEYGQRTPSFGFIKKFKLKFPECNSDDFFLQNDHT